MIFLDFRSAMITFNLSISSHKTRRSTAFLRASLWEIPLALVLFLSAALPVFSQELLSGPADVEAFLD
jgi:hypothetical protein